MTEKNASNTTTQGIVTSHPCWFHPVLFADGLNQCLCIKRVSFLFTAFINYTIFFPPLGLSWLCDVYLKSH